MVPQEDHASENREDPLPDEPVKLPDLGPFEPPSEGVLEPEWADAAPRPIPPEFRKGRHAKRHQRAVWGFLAAGLLCVLCGLLPIMRLWGLFFLPLAYLTWIGIGCAVLAAGASLSSLVRRGPYRYFTQGVPLPARIVRLELRTTVVVNGQPSTCGFVALIEFRSPETGQIVYTETKSKDFSATLKNELTTSYRVGDYVTAVYLDSDPVGSLRLYGFLDLKPGLGLIKRDQTGEDSPLKIILLVGVIFFFFGILFWNVYAYGRYEPIEFTSAQGVIPFAIGAVLLGGGLLGLLAWQGASEKKKTAERNRRAQELGEAVEVELDQKHAWFGVQGLLISLILIAGAILLGGLTMLCWCFSANAMLDRSPAEPRLVQIGDMIMTTHSGIFREYTIEYQFPEDIRADATRKLLSTPGHMMQFETDAGMAQVRPGRFGWPWVETIEPLNLQPVPPAGDELGERDRSSAK